METLFRWSKFVDEEQLEEWETLLIMEEVAFVVEKPIHRKRWQISSYVLTRAEAEELQSRFGGGVNEVRPADWQPSEEDGEPTLLKIRDSLVVTLSENESTWQDLREVFPDREVLSFPPQLAFGTGGHPTTAGCLRFVADIAKEREGSDWTLLDLGCGSGILAVAAVKLGAKRVVAVEIDDLAMGYAKRNAERHGVEDRIEFLEEDAISLIDEGSLGSFDVIAANLFSTLLVQLLPALPKALHEGGDIVLSGFLTSQAREVAGVADKIGLPLKDFLRRGKWVAGRGAASDC